MTPDPQSSPLIQRLLGEFGYPALDLAGADAFIEGDGDAVLLFPGDVHRLDESADVAVVLPELVAAFGHRLRAGLVLDKEAERSLQRRYRFNAFPALVFLRGGGWLGNIQRMHDWGDYVRDIQTILAGEPKDPPPFELPDGCITAGAPVRTH